ncbi:MAG: hypothetical protein JF887_08395 [Candidatus Dormibacteraeota bacterium]|uniref:Uncharacterized protein n=1 Tax=Candidatus Amunia macphersoniae TaxID=3127014 RepID=A0A934KFB5_9BACT|nr:hypothetical protein [Candidatus Dormibacteraeota bacterium]
MVERTPLGSGRPEGGDASWGIRATKLSAAMLVALCIQVVATSAGLVARVKPEASPAMRSTWRV